MTRRRVGPVCAFVLSLGCEPRITPTDFRYELPSHADWLSRMEAPGRLQVNGTRTVRGAAARVLVTGAPGRYELSVTLSATACEGPDGNAAIIDVRANGFPFAKWTVLPGDPFPFKADVMLGQKPQRLDFLYTNDFATRDCDRNVTVHEVVITSAVAEAAL